MTASIKNMNDIANAVESYFTTLHECDLVKFDQIFHPCSSLFDATDGKFTAMPIAEYRTIIGKRISPISVGQNRDDELISIDFLSSDAAVVKVRLRIHDKVFIDHLNFVRSSRNFRIVAKVWHDVTPIR